MGSKHSSEKSTSSPMEEKHHTEIFDVSTRSSPQGKKKKQQLHYRLLTLEGQTGAVFCRVHDRQSMSTTPSLSENGRWEFATRSLLRMFNLVVFRGRDRAASMIGPGDYFGNIEKPNEHAFTIEGMVDFEEDHQTEEGENNKDIVDPAMRSNEDIPHFVPHPLEKATEPRETEEGTHRSVDFEKDCISLQAEWISGQLRPELVKKKLVAEYAGADPFGGSLFPHPGLLEINVGGRKEESEDPTTAAAPPHFIFPKVDATKLDLTPFFARLVKNDVPFRITDQPIKAKDEYRPVSYEFGPNYAENAVKDGSGGLFLETHDFTQTMTPLDEDCRGYIILGRWRDGRNGHKNLHERGVGEKENRALRLVDETLAVTSGILPSKKKPSLSKSSTSTFCSPSSDALNEEDAAMTARLSEEEKAKLRGPQLLDLIAVQIPFGYTLLVDKGCMHGDTTFIGNYMMSMTSNHVTMQDADTVFLKDAETKKNIRFAINGDNKSDGGGTQQHSSEPDHQDASIKKRRRKKAPRPIMVFSDATREELDQFKEETKGCSFMLQPFSKLSWITTMYRRFGVAPGMNLEKKESK